jgi:hypothetical protein
MTAHTLLTPSSDNLVSRGGADNERATAPYSALGDTPALRPAIAGGGTGKSAYKAVPLPSATPPPGGVGRSAYMSSSAPPLPLSTINGFLQSIQWDGWQRAWLAQSMASFSPFSGMGGSVHG